MRKRGRWGLVLGEDVRSIFELDLEPPINFLPRACVFMHLVAILIRKMMRSTEMPNLWIPFSNWQNGLIGDASTEWRCSYKWVEAQLQIRCRVRVVAGRPAVSKSLLKPRSSTSAEQIRVKPTYIVLSSSSSPSSSSLLSLISPPDDLWSAGHKSVLTEYLLKCLDGATSLWEQISAEEGDATSQLCKSNFGATSYHSHIASKGQKNFCFRN